MIRVLLVDDHPVVRDGLRWLCESTADLVVVGEAGDGEQAVALAAALAPDVVVMDLAMPGVDGIAAIRRIRVREPEVRVLVLTLSDAEASLVEAIGAGAGGYVVKGAGRDELLRAVRAVAAGEAVFGAAVAARLLALVRPLDRVAVVFPQLTEREREVLELMARGADNTAIATRLVLAPKTVRNHVSMVLAKLHAADRSAVIVAARQAGLGTASGNPG